MRLENGRPAANARVAVLGTPATTRTDSTGAFRLGGLPSGSQSVEVRMIGYAPTWRGVLLRPDSTVRLEIVLDRAHELPSISIVGARANRLQRLPEFERRRRTGMGRYLTREQIEARNPIDVTDLFRTIPGVRVEWNGSDYVLLSSRGASLSGPCQIPIWLDGRPVLGDFPLDALVRPHDVEAIEVYSGSTVPAELGGLRAGCGAVVIWTRR